MYRPQTDSRTLFLCMVLVVSSIVITPSSITTAATTSAMNQHDIVVHTNLQRVGAGMSPVVHDGQLSDIASQKARLMAERGDFAHTLVDGTTAWSLMADDNYVYAAAGENLAVLFESSAAVVSAWMHSEAHRAAMLNDTYTHIGIGIAIGMHDGYEGYYVVQLLARPL